MARLLRTTICAYHPPAGAPYDLEANLEGALAMVGQAADEGADLAVLPETFAVQNAPDWMGEAQPLDGRVVSALSAEAARRGIWIAANHPTLEDGVKFNSTFLLNRSGELAAVYHKTFPTIWELEGGIVPGDGPLVVETELGRIGFAICYDLNFAELRLGYRDLRPNVILFCSAFRGGLQTTWWAYETRSYMVSSVLDPKSVVVNPVGRTVASTDTWTRTVTHDLNLDYAVVHYDYTNHSLHAALRSHSRDFQFEWSEPEGVMLISAVGSRSASSLVREMGWQEAEDYFARARLTRERAAAGERIEKGPPGW